jgi:hypothetical protein
MLSWLKKLLTIKTEKDYVNDYLADSISLQDLERRQHELRKRGYLP